MALETKRDIDLSMRSTLRLGGTAAAEVVVREEADLPGLAEALKGLGHPVCVVGRGSNLLFGPGELNLTLLRPKFAGNPVETGRTDDGASLVRVGAGVPLGRLVLWAETKGLGGLCGLAGIPGDVGGSVAGNAGSYGCDLGSVLHDVTIWDEERGLVRLQRDDVDIGYRRFSIKPRCAPAGQAWMIVAATFALPKDDPLKLYAKRREALANKKASQPLRAPSCGSCFKNPDEGPAWKFLSEAGFRGKRIQGVGFSEKHANFLINDGHGEPQAAFEIIRQAQEKVLAQSGVRLELEVRVIA